MFSMHFNYISTHKINCIRIADKENTFILWILFEINLCTESNPFIIFFVI